MPTGSAFFHNPYRKSAYASKIQARFRGNKARRSTVVMMRRKPKPSIRKNYKINRYQSKQIRSIKKQLNGQLQRNLHLSREVGFNNTRPLLFDCTDFTSNRAAPGGQVTEGCQVWSLDIPTQNNLDVLSRFSTVNYQTNSYWNLQNNDLVGDTGFFKPVYGNYQIEIKSTLLAGNYPITVQVDLFTQYAGFNNGQNLSAARVLPGGLRHLKEMVDQNVLNSSFFRHYKRIRIPLNQGAKIISNDTGAYLDRKYIKFSVHPKKRRYQFDTAPSVPGTAEDPNVATEEGTYGKFNVDPSTPFWCLISTDLEGTNQGVISAQIRRDVGWRDQQGSAKIL